MSTSVISSDFTTFLKMLTVQLRNQDPMNPMQSTDFAVQLATFAGVEQQVRTNTLLGDMAAGMALSSLGQMASWVGQEARTAQPVRFDGTPVRLSPSPAIAADRAVLVVRDALGQVVAREDIPPRAEPYEWFGADAAGDPLPPGSYSLTLESWRGGQPVAEGAVESYARVLEVRGGPGGLRVVLEGGAEVPATSVSALRAPAGR